MSTNLSHSYFNDGALTSQESRSKRRVTTTGTISPVPMELQPQQSQQSPSTPSSPSILSSKASLTKEQTRQDGQSQIKHQNSTNTATSNMTKTVPAISSNAGARITTNISTETLTSSENARKRRKARFQYYGELCFRTPPTDENIPEDLVRPLQSIYKQVRYEYENQCNIRSVAAIYARILGEFNDVSEPYRKTNPAYNRIYTNIVETLQRVYHIKPKVLYIRPHLYSVDKWGPLYWRFMHYTSILISVAMMTGKIRNLLDFPIFIYNINLILPCHKCIAHYLTVKESSDIHAIIKMLSFGRLIYGVRLFHEAITKNIHQHELKERTTMIPPTMGPDNVPPKFTEMDFAELYGCGEWECNPYTEKTEGYFPSVVEWLAPTHMALTTLLAYYCNHNYKEISTVIKTKIYRREIVRDISRPITPHLIETMMPAYNYEIHPMSRNDVLVHSLTAKQIEWCLAQAILMQVEDTILDDDYLTIDRHRYKRAIDRLYSQFPDEIRRIAECYFQSGNQRLLSKWRNTYGKDGSPPPPTVVTEANIKNYNEISQFINSYNQDDTS